MLNTRHFGMKMKEYGFQFYSGVPCSFLKDLINYAINDCRYIMATNEGDAVAACAGAYIGGMKSVVLMQNSGLTNAISPLTSLNYIFKIPVLGFVSLRGEPGLQDEPQHELMGSITTSMLDIMKIKWEYISNIEEEALEQLDRANESIEKEESFFFVVRKGTFDKVALKKQPPPEKVSVKITDSKYADTLPLRMEVLQKVVAFRDKNTVFIASTGFTGRELYEIEDTPNNFYMVGSLGCAGSIGLGLSVVQSKKDIIVIDGDGAVLMRMGSLATNGYYRNENMLHILLDNNAHESTGGQKTVSQNIDFPGIAASCGYPNVVYAHNMDELKNAMIEWNKKHSLTFIYIRIRTGSKENLARPKIKPFEVKERLMRFIEQ